VLPICLTGEALATYESLTSNIKKNWKDLVNELARRFLRSDDAGRHLRNLQNRVQKVNEGIIEFSNDIKKLVDRAFPLIPNPAPADTSLYFTQEHRTRFEVEFFLNGLKIEIKAYLLRKNKPQTLEDAIEAAIKEENIQIEILRSQIEDEKISQAKIAAAVNTNMGQNGECSSNSYYRYGQNSQYSPRYHQNNRQNFPNYPQHFRNNYQNYGYGQDYKEMEDYNESWEPEYPNEYEDSEW
jgi:hypothetical protein